MGERIGGNAFLDHTSLEYLVFQCCDTDFGFPSHFHIGDFGLGNGDFHLYAVDLHDPNDRHTRCGLLTHLHLLGGDHAAERRANGAVVEILTGDPLHRFGLLQLALHLDPLDLGKAALIV